MPCPDEATIAALVAGALDPEERPAVEAHLDACDLCQALVALLARSSVAATVRELDTALPAAGSDGRGRGGVASTRARWFLADVLLLALIAGGALVLGAWLGAGFAGR